MVAMSLIEFQFLSFEIKLNNSCSACSTWLTTGASQVDAHPKLRFKWAQGYQHDQHSKGISYFHPNCCGVAELPFTNNEGKLKSQESKPKLRHKRKKTKDTFSTVNFLKVDPLYKCRSVSFYREASRLFTYRDYPRVKRIETEYARLILGSLQLGLHVIRAPWRHAANHGAFLVVSTCACREKTLSFLETPLSPGTFFHPKHKSKPNLSALDVRGDETPWVKPKP
jgi:hypothetical protein